MRSIGDAVIVTDADLAVTHLNATAQQLTGWSETEAIGASLHEVFRLLRADTRDPQDSPATRALEANQTVVLTHDTILVAKDGSERFVSDSVAPVTGEHGELAGVVVVFRDVTKQRDERNTKEIAAASETLLLQITDAQRKTAEAREIMRIPLNCLAHF